MFAIRNLETLCRAARGSHLTLLKKSLKIYPKSTFTDAKHTDRPTLADLLTRVRAHSFKTSKGDSSVIIVSWQYGPYNPGIAVRLPGRSTNFLFSKAPKLSLRSIQPPVQWVRVGHYQGVKRSERLAYHTSMYSVPLATEPGISLIILTLMKILQRNLNRSTFVVWEMWPHHNMGWKWPPFASRKDWIRRPKFSKSLPVRPQSLPEFLRWSLGFSYRASFN
jgi:hypothetical protein